MDLCEPWIKAYLRIKLGAVVILTAVQGNNLVTNDIITSLEIPWDSGGRCEISFDEVISSPDTRATRDDQAVLGDLAPLKRARSKCSAVPCTLIRCDISSTIKPTYRCKGQCS